MRVLFASQVLKNAGRVAQLVEQRIENPRVGSSILPPATNIKRPALWLGVFISAPARFYF